MNWKRSEAFRAQADRCSEIARLMSTSEGKREFEKLARGWARMAENAEKEESLKEESLRHRSATPAGRLRKGIDPQANSA
jgi:hypothetical protein